jgi:TRAP-type mannitol/chloroaromatic compound transport system permease small subunit
MMPLSAVLLLLQGVSEFVKCWERAFGPGADEPEIVSAGADGEVAT